jgi:hypothetical protein
VGRDSSVGIATATGWTVRGSKPGGGRGFPHLARLALLYKGLRVFPGVKWPGRGAEHTPPFSAEVKERVEQYLYSPSGPPWPVLGGTLP